MQKTSAATQWGKMYVELSLNGKKFKWEVLDNHAAKLWLNKIKKIQVLPLSTLQPPNQKPNADLYAVIKSFISKHHNIIDPRFKHLMYNDIFGLEDLNQCHQVYEEIFKTHLKDINSNELHDFHMYIHSFQDSGNNANQIQDGNFRTFGWGVAEGLLIKPITQEELSLRTTDVKQGWLYLKWGEFGKLPHHYFSDNEPMEYERFMQAVKPWLLSSPKITVSVGDRNKFMDDDFAQRYQTWIDSIPYWNEWMAKYNLSNWDVNEEFGVIPIAVPCFAHSESIVFSENIELENVTVSVQM